MILKKGDKVILISKRFGDTVRNPVFRKNKREIIGTIINIRQRVEEICPITVLWSNGYKNVYDKEDLECISHPKIGDKIKDTRTNDIGIVTKLIEEKVYAKWLKDNTELFIHVDDVEKILV